ncbi:ABC transporter permease [Rhizobium sp. G187]|uniref:ABC transporter permease n=1 Tax=Rhizobium sp. G187 TaxID=3451352 RepID=UPI003EE5A1CD
MMAHISIQKRVYQFLSVNWAIMALVAIWQLGISLFNVNAIVVPAPLDVLRDIVGNSGIYVLNGMQTLLLAFSGMLVGMLAGTVIAILISQSRILNGLLLPVSLILASVPVVTIIPLLARLFGYDMRTVLVIVAVISFFPAFVFTISGMRAFSRTSADLFSVLGAPYLVRLRHLYLPAAVPNWMIALRLTAPSAFLSAMVAEYLIGKSGFGYLFRQAASAFETDRAFGTSAIATVISIMVFGLVTRLERRILRLWQ